MGQRNDEIRRPDGRADIMSAATIRLVSAMYHRGWTIQGISETVNLTRAHINWAIDEAKRRGLTQASRQA